MTKLKRIMVCLLSVTLLVAYSPAATFAASDNGSTAAEQTVTLELGGETQSSEPKEDKTAPAAESTTEKQKAEDSTKEPDQKAEKQEKTAPTEPSFEAVEETAPAEAEQAAEEQTQQEGVMQEAPVEEVDDTELTKADLMAYNFFWIQEYADKKYVNADEVDLNDFIAPAALAKGVASYNMDKEKQFDIESDLSNFIANLTYDIPLYDVDHDSDYYVAIPDVNYGDPRFGSYDFEMSYNNEHAEMISGYHFDKAHSIAYIPKKVVDRPKNDEALVEGKDVPIAMQMNYYFKKDPSFNDDVVFKKSIPISVLHDEEQTNLVLEDTPLFDVATLIKTGVKDKSKVQVFINGEMFPLYEDAFHYEPSSGELLLDVSPAVVSSINVVFPEDTILEKTARVLFKGTVLSAFADTPSDSVVTKDDMKTYKHGASTVTLNMVKAVPDEDKTIEIGWRGYYDARVKHTNSKDKLKKLTNWENSLKYMYGGYVAGYKMAPKYQNANNHSHWAIRSYALGVNIMSGTKLSKNGKIKRGTGGSDVKKTAYDWMVYYSNRLEKANTKSIGNSGLGPSDGGKYGVNGLGGRNNFAFSFPATITGSRQSGGNIIPTGKPGANYANPDFKFYNSSGTAAQKIIDTKDFMAASCSHIGKEVNAVGPDTYTEHGDAHDVTMTVYVTCIGKKWTSTTTSGNVTKRKGYIVLAFTSANKIGKGQCATAIYKFNIKEDEIDDEPVTLKVVKKAKHPKFVAGQAAYTDDSGKVDFTGAVYAVYETKADAQNADVKYADSGESYYEPPDPNWDAYQDQIAADDTIPQVTFSNVDQSLMDSVNVDDVVYAMYSGSAGDNPQLLDLSVSEFPAEEVGGNTVIKCSIIEKSGSTLTVELVEDSTNDDVDLGDDVVVDDGTEGAIPSLDEFFDGDSDDLGPLALDDEHVGIFEMKADGTAKKALKMDPGTYYVVEIRPPKGFERNTAIQTVTLSPSEAGKVKTVETEEDHFSIHIKIKKKTANQDVIKNNPLYSLANAKYTMYTDAACTDILKCFNESSGASENVVFTTDANGDTTAREIPIGGPYYIKETAHPLGFITNTQVYGPYYVIEPGNQAYLDWQEAHPNGGGHMPALVYHGVPGVNGVPIN